ncbi:MAG: STAS domain-containing protein [Nitrospirales bacterium]
MVRLTVKATQDGTTTVEIEGRIVSEWINVVETECQGLLAQGNEVVLDFTAVNFVETEGVRMIRRLITKGCRVVNCPPFIHQILFT